MVTFNWGRNSLLIKPKCGRKHIISDYFSRELTLLRCIIIYFLFKFWCLYKIFINRYFIFVCIVLLMCVLAANIQGAPWRPDKLYTASYLEHIKYSQRTLPLWTLVLKKNTRENEWCHILLKKRTFIRNINISICMF